MPDESPRNDPRNIWQNQPTEKFKMPEEQIRRRAQRLHSDARLEALGWMGIGSLLFFSFARTFLRTEDLVPRLGWGVLSLWGLYAVFQAYRWIWPGRLEPGATAGTSLQFYRKELERRRDYVRNVWRRSGLTFCFLGLAMIVVPVLMKSHEAPRLLRNAIPFFLLLGVWIALFVPMRRRKQRRIQEDIDDLNGLE